MTIFKPKRVTDLEARVNELEAQLGTEQTQFVPSGTKVANMEPIDYTKRHFAASSLPELEAEAEKIKVLSAQARALTPARNAAKTPPPIHRAVAPAPVVFAPTETSAKAFAVALLDEQERRAAVKPLTGLAKVTAAFQRESAAKSATAKPAAKNPEVSNLTGLAKVTASFKAQAVSNSNTK